MSKRRNETKRNKGRQKSSLCHAKYYWFIYWIKGTHDM